MDLELLKLVASSVTLIRAIADAHPQIAQTFTSHIPFHNAWSHILNTDLPAVLGAEATAHVAVPVDPTKPEPIVNQAVDIAAVVAQAVTAALAAQQKPAA